MGERRRFRAGFKVPNDGVYIEIGEDGSSVMNPRLVKLKAGQQLPENSNHNRIWTLKGGE